MDNIFVVKDNQIDLNEDIIVMESKSGLPIVKFKGFYLNSQYDPVKEAKQLAKVLQKKSCSCTFWVRLFLFS